MKKNLINFLIEQQTNFTELNVNNLPKISNNSNTTPLGVGAYSDVYDKDGHSVNKINSKKFKKDTIEASYYYLNMVTDHKFSGNPHAPKLYEIKRIADKNTGDYFMRVNMESLISHTELDYEQLKSAFYKIFKNPSDADDILVDTGHGNVYHTQLKICRFIKNVIMNNTFYQLTDNFLQVCHAIKHLLSVDSSLSLDLNPDNVMYRTGIGGFWPVITDPLEDF